MMFLRVDKGSLRKQAAFLRSGRFSRYSGRKDAMRANA